ncbi:MAG: hypothetical protein V4507_04095 [Verrucomicrobiota bacterium]
MNRKIKNPIGSIKNKRRSGVALLMSLSFIVFLTLLMMAFFSRALLQRKISSASTAITKTDMMAKSCLDLIVGDLKSEIYAGSSVYGKNGLNDKTEPFLYLPTANTNVVVQRSGVSGKNTDEANLVKISGNQPSFILNGQSGRIVGSSLGTDEEGSLGQKISRDQWKNGPLLVKEMEKAPTWVTLTRSGVQSEWKPDLVNKKSSDYGVGRFAYAIYDVSGLMDMNVAGYPKDLVTDSGTVNTKMLRQKGNLAWSSLDALGSGANPLSISQGQDLVRWRLRKTSTDAMLYTNYLYGFGATNGFMKVLEGDNQFLGRREIIRMAKKEGFKEALPILTTFTREKNAPSFTFASTIPSGEASNYPVEGRLARNTASPEYPNKIWFGYRMAKEGKSPESSPQITWESGDPLILRRFSLDRLSWLTFKGPSASLSTSDPFYKAEGTTENIRYYFGLTWDSNNDEWIYTGSNGSGSSGAGSIKTLAAVVTENREPNLFELLKAFIHTDVMGMEAAIPGKYCMCPNRYQFDQLSDLQILRMGACMVDQADKDRYPTIISYTPQYIPGTSGNIALKAQGVENLPYVAMLMLQYFNPNWPLDFPGATATPADFGTRQLDLYLVPELWNPHQTNLVTTADMPDDLRLSFTGSIRTTRYDGKNGSPWYTALSTNSWVTIPKAGFNDYFPAPRRIRNSVGITGMVPGVPSTGGSFNNLANIPGGVDFNILGSKLTAASAVPFPTTVHDGYGNANLYYVTLGSNAANNLNSTLDAYLSYKNYHGIYKIYNCFAGADSSSANFSAASGIGTKLPGNEGFFAAVFNSGTYNVFRMDTVSALPPAQYTSPIPFASYGNAAANFKSYYQKPVGYVSKSDVRTSRMEVGNYAHYEFRADLSFRPEAPSNPTLPNSSLLAVLPNPYMAQNFAELFNPSTYGYISGTQASAVGKGRGFPLGRANGWSSLGAGSVAGRRLMGNITSVLSGSVSDWPMWNPAMLSENRNTGQAGDTFYYDSGPGTPLNGGRVRPGDSALIGRYTGVDNPTLASQRSIYNNVNAMPVVLDRPFQSVAELGNVFMDIPYRSMDFFSSESVNAGLLDVFTVTPASSASPVTAGCVNPNTRYSEVLAAVLANAGRNEKGDRFISSQEAATIAKDVVSISSGSNGAFQNRADLVTRASAYKVGVASDTSTQVTVSGFEDSNDSTPYPTIKGEREAPIRALAPVSNTRTWNLLIDTVVQSGRYPTTANKLQDFTVEGQRRCWMHVAIDRYTGEVLDQQVEWIQ